MKFVQKSITQGKTEQTEVVVQVLANQGLGEAAERVKVYEPRDRKDRSERERGGQGAKELIRMEKEVWERESTESLDRSGVTLEEDEKLLHELNSYKAKVKA
ncbi:hypothetical protein FRC07_002121 [Ceratobasidium sp. 392]|nr:hypothetical protein FRC07_002121 [Ceratobasidium sp. 392]